MLNVIVIIVGVLLIGGGFGYAEYQEKSGVKSKKPISLIVVGIACIITSFSFKIIPTGYTGVRTIFGQVNEKTVSNGLNWKVPFVESIETINNKQQDIVFDNTEIWSETSERTALYYTGITVTYAINKDKSAWIYTNISNYEKDLVSQTLVSSAIKESSKDLSATDATNRGIIEPLAMKNIQESLNEKYGEDVVIVNKVVISNADFEESYNKSIAKKQKAQLSYEQQQIDNKKSVEQAEAEADSKIKKAEGEAEASKIAANAEAEVRKIMSLAEAEANRELANSLSENILRQMLLNRWNGELPKVVGEGETMLNIDGVLGE